MIRGASCLRSGVGPRLIGALALVSVIWLMVAWALA